jgi:chaperonin cofactor prefoldin
MERSEQVEVYVEKICTLYGRMRDLQEPSLDHQTTLIRREVHQDLGDALRKVSREELVQELKKTKNSDEYSILALHESFSKSDQKNDDDDLTARLGTYDSSYKIAEEEISKEYKRAVKGSDDTFRVVVGPLHWNDTTFENTYMIEINYRDLGGRIYDFYKDYARQVNKLAQDFCEEHGFEINKHINSWPEFQAVVVKK